MTPNVRSAWRAQSPRLDFAARTVAAIVRDRSEGRRRADPRRWVSASSVAFLLVIVGAWAWAALPRSATKQESLPDVGAARGNARATIPVWRAPAVPEPSAPPHPVLRLAPTAKALPRRDTAPVNTGRHVNLPRCGCDPTICDCVEPQ